MEERYTELAVRLENVDSRARSNTNRLDECEKDIKEVKEEQKALYELATSVKLISQSLTYMENSLDSLKQGQVEMTNKVDKKISDIKNEVEKVNNKTRIDWATFITSNFWKIALGGGAIYGACKLIYELLTK